MTATVERLMTAEEFWDCCAGTDDRVELVAGRVIRMAPVSFDHGSIDTSLAAELSTFVRRKGLGRVVQNTGFILTRDPDVVRGPDQAFVTAERMAADPPPRAGFWATAPDLVVEIISPGDTAAEVNEKVGDYLRAGVRVVWLVYPGQREVHVVRPDGTARILRETDELDGGDVIPGFRLRLDGLWD
jgi:Uma2 family endonuclease